jgi:uncharacterized membrane protein (DUF485 family)
MLREYLRLARPYLVLLAVFAVGRWTMGLREVPYANGHHVFSLVTMTTMACIFYGAFTRRWLGYRILRSVGLGMTLGFCNQFVIFVLTAVSYILGMNTYFNHPTALNAEGPVAFGAAMGGRLGGMVANTLFSGIIAALGWFFGSVLPDSTAPARRETIA